MTMMNQDVISPPRPDVHLIHKVVVGSLNPVKIAAVNTVVQRVWPGAMVVGVAVESGVSHQPLSDEEAIAGATQRAQLARLVSSADLGVGLEGNTVDTGFGMFTTGWAAVAAHDGTVSLGSSGRLPLPALVAQAVRQGEELGPLMDQLAGEHNTKQRQGAVGILTNGLLTRQAALEIAVLYALARFLHPLYQTAGHHGG
jgi:inosine/xanthosine triphosphatase